MPSIAARTLIAITITTITSYAVAKNVEHGKYSKTDASRHSANIIIPTECTCCESMIEYLESAGYKISHKYMESSDVVKQRQNVPKKLKRCVTTVIDGYLIEGQVPIHSIEKFLHAPVKPFGSRTVGLSVTVDVQNRTNNNKGSNHYNIVAFTREGHSTVIDRYQP